MGILRQDIVQQECGKRLMAATEFLTASKIHLAGCQYRRARSEVQEAMRYLNYAATDIRSLIANQKDSQ